MTAFIVTGTAEQMSEALFGPRQHNEHCKGYRFHQYVADMQIKERAASVKRAADQIIAEAYARRSQVQFSQAAE